MKKPSERSVFCNFKISWRVKWFENKVFNSLYKNPVSSFYLGLPSIGDLWNNSYTFRNDSKDYGKKKEQSFLIINFKSSVEKKGLFNIGIFCFPLS